MKVMFVNGSSHLRGTTMAAIEEMEKVFRAEGIETEVIQVGGKPIADCLQCNVCGKIGKCVFTDDGVNEFVEKVVVHEAVKIEGKRTMQVDIYLNFIGKFDLPEQEAAQAATPEKTRKKQQRREMSEEQREILRKRDKERYARKTAAKKAAEEAARAEILKGTA